MCFCLEPFRILSDIYHTVYPNGFWQMCRFQNRKGQITGSNGKNMAVAWVCIIVCEELPLMLPSQKVKVQYAVI